MIFKWKQFYLFYKQNIFWKQIGFNYISGIFYYIVVSSGTVQHNQNTINTSNDCNNIYYFQSMQIERELEMPRYDKTTFGNGPKTNFILESFIILSYLREAPVSNYQNCYLLVRKSFRIYNYFFGTRITKLQKAIDILH